MKKVLIFTGAGISKPLDLPVTEEFANIISSSCNSIMATLKMCKPEAKYDDIEVVLSLLESLTHDDNFWYKWIYKKVAGNGSYSSLHSELATIRRGAKEAETELKRHIYEKLDNFNRKAAVDLYYNLIKEIKNCDAQSCISFFTANYDLTFERFEDELDGLRENLDIKEVDYGFPFRHKKQVFDANNRYEWAPDSIEYKKLHGSLDWVMRDGVCVKTGAKTIPNNPHEMPLLYPGFKGTPAIEPFISLHGQFFERMREADIIIFIGFAFRDPYINNLINIILASENEQTKKVLCYNPASLEALPKESKLSDLVNRYKDRFVHIQKGIAIEENPLDLKNELTKFV